MPTPLDESLEQQTQQIDSKQNQILDTSRNIRRLAEESQDAAAHTMTALNEQKEKLNNVESGLDRIDNKLDEAEAGLEELDKCCGLCVLPWKRIKTKKKTNKKKSGKDNQAATTNSEADEQNNKSQNNTNTNNNPSNLSKIIEGDEREDEINENVQYASKAVNNLHAMALDMGMELTDQNNQLDRINDKAGGADDRLEGLNQAATNRLK